MDDKRELPDKFSYREFKDVIGAFNERQTRMIAANPSNIFGHGCAGQICGGMGISRNTANQGKVGLQDPSKRKDPGAGAPGAGRRKLGKSQPKMLGALIDLLEPDTYGDPMTQFLCAGGSHRKHADALAEKGFPISPNSVGKLLEKLGYRRKKTKSSFHCPKRPRKAMPIRSS